MAESKTKKVLQCIGDTCRLVAHGVGQVSNAVAPYAEYIPVVGQAVGIASTALQKSTDYTKMEHEIKLLETVEGNMLKLLAAAKESPYKVCSLSALEQALDIVGKRIRAEYAAQGKLARGNRGGWPELYRSEVRGDMILLQTAAANVLLELNMMQSQIAMIALEDNEAKKIKLLTKLTTKCMMQPPEEA